MNQSQIFVGQNDVGTVWLDLHAVGYLENPHPGVPADQFGQDALVVRVKVLNDDKRDAGFAIGWHMGEERLEGCQAAG